MYITEGESLGGFDDVRTLMTCHARHQCLHVIKALPLHRYIYEVITRIKQSGGGEPGDEATHTPRDVT